MKDCWVLFFFSFLTNTWGPPILPLRAVFVFFHAKVDMKASRTGQLSGYFLCQPLVPPPPPNKLLSPSSFYRLHFKKKGIQQKELPLTNTTYIARSKLSWEYGPTVSCLFHIYSCVNIIIFSLAFVVKCILKVNICPKTLSRKYRMMVI